MQEMKGEGNSGRILGGDGKDGVRTREGTPGGDEREGGGQQFMEALRHSP